MPPGTVLGVNLWLPQNANALCTMSLFSFCDQDVLVSPTPHNIPPPWLLHVGQGQSCSQTYTRVLVGWTWSTVDVQTGVVTWWWQTRDGVKLWTIEVDPLSSPHQNGCMYQTYVQHPTFALSVSTARVYPNSINHVGAKPNHIWDYCVLNNALWANPPPTL